MNRQIHNNMALMLDMKNDLIHVWIYRTFSSISRCETLLCDPLFIHATMCTSMKLMRLCDTNERRSSI